MKKALFLLIAILALGIHYLTILKHNNAELDYIKENLKGVPISNIKPKYKDKKLEEIKSASYDSGGGVVDILYAENSIQYKEGKGMCLKGDIEGTSKQDVNANDYDFCTEGIWYKGINIDHHKRIGHMVTFLNSKESYGIIAYTGSHDPYIYGEVTYPFTSLLFMHNGIIKDISNEFANPISDVFFYQGNMYVSGYGVIKIFNKDGEVLKNTTFHPLSDSINFRYTVKKIFPNYYYLGLIGPEESGGEFFVNMKTKKVTELNDTRGFCDTRCWNFIGFSENKHEVYTHVETGETKNDYISITDLKSGKRSTVKYSEELKLQIQGTSTKPMFER